MPLLITKTDADERLAKARELQCDHSKRLLTRRTLANGGVSVVEQCQGCGDQIGKAQKRLPEHETLPQFDDTLKTRKNAERAKEFRDFVRSQERDAARKWIHVYNEYLRSPEWLGKRQSVLERENYLCQGCRRNRATQAHHTTYRHQGEEFLFELIALCASCHERYHQSFVDGLAPQGMSYADILDANNG